MMNSVCCFSSLVCTYSHNRLRHSKVSFCPRLVRNSLKSQSLSVSQVHVCELYDIVTARMPTYHLLAQTEVRKHDVVFVHRLRTPDPSTEGQHWRVCERAFLTCDCSICYIGDFAMLFSLVLVLLWSISSNTNLEAWSARRWKSIDLLLARLCPTYLKGMHKSMQYGMAQGKNPFLTFASGNNPYSHPTRIAAFTGVGNKSIGSVLILWYHVHVF